MPWIARGLAEGTVTTRYPHRPDGYGDGFRASVRVTDAAVVDAGLPDLCPAGAIAITSSTVRLDRGRCVLCGACVAARPDVFSFDASAEIAATARPALVVPAIEETDEDLARLRADLDRRVRGLRRSIHIRHVDSGSDGSEEWEVAALTNPVYDVQRLGIYFTASPRHADVLLLTGLGAVAMRPPLARTYEAMPEPRIVIAAGVDAVGGGVMGPGYAAGAGVGDLLPVDVWVPGSPPSPFSLLHGLLLAVGLVAERGSGG